MQKFKVFVISSLLLCGGVLGAAVKKQAPVSMHLSPETCMANAIYYEAGNQFVLGKAAVGRVIVNRVNAGAKGGFANNVCGVVYQGIEHHNCQFRFGCRKVGKKVNQKQYEQCMFIARQVLCGEYSTLFTDNVLYFNGRKSGLHFAGIRKYAVIGGHVFYEKTGSRVPL
jgi:spore germination cell wall hydrolase CwlJ-like protein